MDGNVAVQIPLYPPIQDVEINPHCFSISPDRNWILYNNVSGTEIKSYLGNLINGQSQEYEWHESSEESAIKWSPDSKHFASSSSSYDFIGSVDGPAIKVGGHFINWIDLNHYFYATISDDYNTVKTYATEIGGELVPVSNDLWHSW